MKTLAISLIRIHTNIEIHCEDSKSLSLDASKKYTYSILLLHRYDDLVDCWSRRSCSFQKSNLSLHSFSTSTVISIVAWANTCSMQGNKKWYGQHFTSKDTSKEVAELLWIMLYSKRTMNALMQQDGFSFSKTFLRKFKESFMQIQATLPFFHEHQSTSSSGIFQIDNVQNTISSTWDWIWCFTTYILNSLSEEGDLGQTIWMVSGPFALYVAN